MANNFTFDGEKKDYIRIMELEMSNWATVERKLSTVPGKVGGVLKSTEIQSKTIKMKLRVEGDGPHDLEEKRQEMAAWLMTKDERPLVLDKTPYWTYYAALDGEVMPEKQVGGFEIVNIEFICPDPYKYGKEKQAIKQRKITWERYKGQTWKEILNGD